MGLVMNTGSVKSQLEAMNGQLNIVVANVGKVSGDISSFRATANALTGETYSSARGMYGTLHNPVVKGIREYAQALIRENNSYKSCISTHLSGIGYVDEDELKKDRASIKQQISYVQNIVADQKGSYTSYLSCLQNALNLVEKKLQQIEDFKGASAGLYQGMDEYSSGIKNGVALLMRKKFNKKTRQYEISAVGAVETVKTFAERVRKNLQKTLVEIKLREMLQKELNDDEIIYIDEIIEYVNENSSQYSLNTILNEDIPIPASVRDACKNQLLETIHEDVDLLISMKRVNMSPTGIDIASCWDDDFASYSNCAELNKYFRKYKMKDEEKILFLGQVYRETGGGSTFMEILTYSDKWESLNENYDEELINLYIEASGKSREDIMYRGYGPLQLTHKDAYETFADYVLEKYGDEDGANDIKEMGVYSEALHNDYSLESAFWFWNNYKNYIEKNNSDDATHAVLGSGASKAQLEERNKITEIIRGSWYEN